MSSLDNVAKDTESKNASPLLLDGELTKSETNVEISNMTAPQGRLDGLLSGQLSDRVISFRTLEEAQEQEPEHVRQVRALAEELVEEIAATGGLHQEDKVSSDIKNYTRSRLDLDSAAAADRLGPEISKALETLRDQIENKDLKKLLDGMKLEIVPDGNLEKSQKLLAQLRGEPVPDYIRTIQLVDKNGKRLGERIDIHVNSVAQELAAKLGKIDQFSADKGPVADRQLAQQVQDFWAERFVAGGEAMADKLGDEITSRLPGEKPDKRTLTITDVSEEMKKIIENNIREAARKNGVEPDLPDCIKRVELKDPQKGSLGVIHIAAKKARLQERPKANRRFSA